MADAKTATLKVELTATMMNYLDVQVRRGYATTREEALRFLLASAIREWGGDAGVRLRDRILPMTSPTYGSPFTAMREALCDPFGLEYERDYGCGSPGDPCSCVLLANAIDQAERENLALRENLEILHDAMRFGGLTHRQGEGYAGSPRCQIVFALLMGDSSPTECPSEGPEA